MAPNDHDSTRNGLVINNNRTANNGCLLVTGGAGYIGSHTVLELIQRGFKDLVVLDNCSNSYIAEGEVKPESLKRIEEMTGTEVTFYLADITDKRQLQQVFDKHTFFCVIHFAGLKAVAESIQLPLMYYEVNFRGAANLLRCMAESGCNNIIFSSSCTVYGEPSREQLPITEQTPAGGCTCAYGRTKYFIEQMLSDYCRANESFNAVNLRYFNPVGAYESGTIGEDPTGVPNCLMPFVAQVATGRRAELGIFGNDYDTPDGTAIRDYVHVVDIAIGHVAALEKLIDNSLKKFLIYNLGTGKGHSVLEVVEAFRKASGAEIPYVIKPRREGDATEVYADCSLAKRDLGWEATRDLETMCRDFWTWQSKNPEGYRQTEKDVKDRRFISCPKL